MHALAREGFHVSKVEEDQPTQPSVKACVNRFPNIEAIARNAHAACTLMCLLLIDGLGPVGIIMLS